MRLENVAISNFRCFGPAPITMAVASEITAIVGPNAAGKTALLHALSKLFGVSRAQRTVQRSDFHVGADDDPDDREPKDLFIDVLISLPELADDTATAETVAPSFRHMQLERDGKSPVCRLRLEARWEDDGTLEGEVSQELFWVDTLEDKPAADKRHPISAADRGLIQLYYTPASRDPAAQVRATAGALAARLLRAIEWSTEAEEAVQEAGENLSAAFEGETAIAAISKALETRWSALHDELVDTKPRLSLVSRRFEEIVSKIAVIFEQGPDGRERALDALSDGQQSLFYFALAAAVFDLEREVVAGDVEGFLDDQLRILDLDLGREGGGFGRVKTAIQKLIDVGAPKAKLLALSNGSQLSDADLAKMHEWQGADGLDNLQGWVDSLKPHGVFFSVPLDLDLAMLNAFPEAYAATIPKGGGPKMAADKAAAAVLGTAGPGLALYAGAFKAYPDLLPAYRYHFLTHSKPATHLAALTHIKTKALRDGMPPILAELLTHIAGNLRRD